MVIAGCHPSTGDHDDWRADTESPSDVTPAPVVPELSFDEQVAQVQAGESDSIRVSEASLSDDDLAKLVDLDQLRVLVVEQGEFTDAGIEHLLALDNLQQLKLGRSPITDDGLAKLGQLENLRFLNLPHAKFTDVGLKSISSMPKLEMLRFGSPRVSNEGFAPLVKLPELRFLHLINVPITDQGLAHIEKLNQLESLYIDGGNITDDGVVRLFEALPDLHFHKDQQHHDLDPKKDHPH